MTVKEYITSKFQQFGITLSDADLADIELSGVNLDDELTEENKAAALTVMVKSIIPTFLLRAKSVSENGFTISWDNDALMTYYTWLCSDLGIEDTLTGVRQIVDITHYW